MRNYVDNTEILAPAGSMDALKFAVNNGANAVYLGLKSYSARHKASNFSFDELSKAIKYAHFYNVRIYLAVNTLYKPNEKEQLLNDVYKAYKLGIDAIIVQDLTILPQIRSTMPDIVVHLSTQAGIHNVYGAKIAEKLGVDRIILSREVSIEDVRQIRDNCNLEIECFVQGALCVSFSGNCYFSSLVSGYSGNRGKCLQLCRKQYVIDNKKKYWLSTKDLRMISHVKKLQDAGVTSFKIEGRLRRPEYVGEAVHAYRQMLDFNKYDLENLSSMYNRGDYTTSHLFNDTENVIYPHVQGHLGKRVGKVVNFLGKKAVISTTLNKGDAVKFITNNVETGTALISNSSNATTYLGNVKIGSEVRLTTDKKLIDEISQRKIFVPISVSIKLEQNKAVKVRIENERVNLERSSDFTMEQAKNLPISNDELKDVFSKCKDFGFELNSIEIENDGASFIVKSALNAFRRSVIEEFYNLYSNSYQKPKRRNTKFEFDRVFAPTNKVSFAKKAIFAETDDFKLIEFLSSKCDYVAYYPRSYKDFCSKISCFASKCYLVLPPIARQKDLKILEEIAQNPKIENVIAQNVYALELFKDKNVLLGAFCNIIDPSFKANKILSIEGGLSDSDFIYSYGTFPLMTFAHCPKKTLVGACKNCDKYDTIEVSDERGNIFKFEHYEVANCYSRLLNSIPVNLSGINSKRQINKIYLDLKRKKLPEVEKIINSFKSGISIDEKGTTAFCNKILE